MLASNCYKENDWNAFQYHHDTSASPASKALILAVINPHSGAGKAIKIFKSIVEPEWKQLGISYQILITKYANHATQLLAQDNHIERFKSIVAIGGDGTLAEVIHGLESNTCVQNVRNSIKLGIIPVGSGNGLYKSLRPNVPSKECVLDATRMVALAASKSMDLMEITQNNEKKKAFLAITLGLIADIDILSEPFRCLGEFRFSLGALWNLWKNKVYKLELSYLPNEFENETAQVWNKISGEFSHLMISNTSHCSSNAHTAPGAKIDDGFLHVSVVKAISVWTRLQLLLGLESGDWVKNPSVWQFKTKAIKIDSLSEDTIVTLDGERIASQPLTCRIQHAALPIIGG